MSVVENSLCHLMRHARRRAVVSPTAAAEIGRKSACASAMKGLPGAPATLLFHADEQWSHRHARVPPPPAVCQLSYSRDVKTSVSVTFLSRNLQKKTYLRVQSRRLGLAIVRWHRRPPSTNTAGSPFEKK